MIREAKQSILITGCYRQPGDTKLRFWLSCGADFNYSVCYLCRVGFVYRLRLSVVVAHARMGYPFIQVLHRSLHLVLRVCSSYDVGYLMWNRLQVVSQPCVSPLGEYS